jgi:hypothetical protein
MKDDPKPLIATGLPSPKPMMSSGHVVITKVGEEIHLKVPFELKDHIKSKIKGCYFDRIARTWVAPATISTYRNIYDLNPNLLAVNKLSPEVRAWVRETKSIVGRLTQLQKGLKEEDHPIVLPEDFWIHPTKSPKKHQYEAFAFCMNLDKSALWLDLGLGKTYTSIMVARFRHYKNQVNRVLIVCPKSIQQQWVDEISEYSEPGKFCAAIVGGTPKRKQKITDALIARSYEFPETLHYLIVTYETLNSLSETIKDNFDMFILDEVTKIKNPGAKRTWGIVGVCDTIKYGLALTGLAYLNDPVDLFPQFSAIDKTIYGTDLYSFRGTYVVQKQLPFGKVDTGVKNLQRLKSRAYYAAFARKKAECLDLPAQVYAKRTLEMTEEQADMYARLVADDSLVPIAKIEKARQILSGFYMNDKTSIIEFDSLKYEETLEIIKGSDDNFVIWAYHAYTMRRIESFLRSNGIHSFVMNRDVKMQDKNSAKKQFQEGDGVLRVIICQLESESRGLQYTSKRQVSTIYFENTFSIDQRWQSESRTHRMGMVGTATYIDLEIQDSIDSSIKDILDSKLTVSEYISQYGCEDIFGNGSKVKKKKAKLNRKKREDQDLLDMELTDDLFADLDKLNNLDTDLDMV